jgi:protein TonB
MLRSIGLIAVLLAIPMPADAQTDGVKEWHKQIVMQIGSKKRFPWQAAGEEGAAKVGFVLDRDGRLISHWLEESTGNRVLDDESLAILERSQPFPAPPPGLNEDRLTLRIPLIFRRHHPDVIATLSKHPEILLTVSTAPEEKPSGAMDEWRKQTVARLNDHRRFPLPTLGQLGTAKVGAVMDRDGLLASHWLKESAGNRALDAESLAIVERAQPFPIPPPDLKGEQLSLEIAFVFTNPPSPWDQEQARLRAKVNTICRGC